MSQYSNTENFCFGVTCAPRASKKNTAVEEKILSRAGKLIVSCKFLSSSLKDTTPVCNSQAVCVDSHNFGVRLLWTQGRNSSLVAERVGTTKHPAAVKLFQGCCSSSSSSRLFSQTYSHFSAFSTSSKSEPGSPHLITKELWKRTGQGGNCDYFDKGISMLSQSKSPLMVVIERCISLH